MRESRPMKIQPLSNELDWVKRESRETESNFLFTPQNVPSHGGAPGLEDSDRFSHLAEALL